MSQPSTLITGLQRCFHDALNPPPSAAQHRVAKLLAETSDTLSNAIDGTVEQRFGSKWAQAARVGVLLLGIGAVTAAIMFALYKVLVLLLGVAQYMTGWTPAHISNDGLESVLLPVLLLFMLEGVLGFVLAIHTYRRFKRSGNDSQPSAVAAYTDAPPASRSAYGLARTALAAAVAAFVLGAYRVCLMGPDIAPVTPVSAGVVVVLLLLPYPFNNLITRLGALLLGVADDPGRRTGQSTRSESAAS